jgi:precorrin-2 dehydrogenase/sirohydrochlorin ferrochelatase
MPVDAPRYPVELVVEGRRCLVVGGGRVATVKARGLLECGAPVHVVATVVGPEVRALPGVTWDERPYRAGDVEGYWLVITATDDPEVNRAVHDDAVARRIWVNSADDPANCAFILPARMHRGDLSVAISTGGRSPAFATWMRRRLESEIGPEFADLLDIVAEVRTSIREAGRSTEGLDWQSALDSGMLELVREGRLAEAKERLQACLSSSSA